MKKSNGLLFYWLPVFIHCLLIYIQSSRPFPISIPDIDHIDKAFHFITYFVLGALFFRALGNICDDSRISRRVILAIIFSSLYGISDEIHQYFVPGRTADPLDAVADMLGSIFGALIYRNFVRRYDSAYPYHSHVDKIKNFL